MGVVQQGGVAAAVITVLAVAYQFLAGGTSNGVMEGSPSSTPAVKPEKVDPSLELKEAVLKSPSNGSLQAKLALSLLQPVEDMPPNANAKSLHGAEFTLHHPNVADSRKAMEMALKLAPSNGDTQLAHQAVLMAEGRAEEAIQPGRKAVELLPTSAHAYAQWARAHLLAACAQGCAARQSLRGEKKAEKKAGRRKSALEQRETEAEEQQKRKESGAKGPGLDRGSLRAGAMWRIMEAGRLLKQGLDVDPSDAVAERLHKDSKRLITLDAMKVLNTEDVMRFGQCEHFFGQALDGSLCDRKRFKYE